MILVRIKDYLKPKRYQLNEVWDNETPDVPEYVKSLYSIYLYLSTVLPNVSTNSVFVACDYYNCDVVNFQGEKHVDTIIAAMTKNGLIEAV